LVALCAALLILVSGSAGLAKINVGWPAWVLPALVAGAGIFASVVLSPLVSARVAVLTGRVGVGEERRRRRSDVLLRSAGPAEALPLVSQVTSRRSLGIHAAIPLPAGADASLSVELPTYVPRDQDVEVRTALTRMATTGGFLLLVGPPASGKTRCAATAMQQLLGDWRLYLRDLRSLAELLDAGVSLRRTVVWLDDVHEILDSSDRAVETSAVGQRLSADLMRRLLLPDIGPVIVFGTTWPDKRDRYASPPRSADADLFADARKIIDMADQIDIAAGLSNSEWRRAQSLASEDPRLAEAVRSTVDRALTSTLANAPEMIRRWRHGGSATGRAVLSAAVFARRCGHPEPIPVDLLRALTEEELSAAERARANTGRWFDDALAWACAPVRGDIAPLTAEATKVGHIDGYRVSDILLDRGGDDGGTESIAGNAWRLIVAHAKPTVCLSIALAAYRARLFDVAEAAARRSTEAGDPSGMFTLAFLLKQRGDVVEAEALYRRAIDAGNTGALNNLANLLTGRGDVVEAEALYRRAIDAGHTNALNNLAVLLGDRGDVVEAEALYRRAIDAGNTDALNNLAFLLKQRGDVVEAEALYRRAIDAGHTKGR